jgi:uncharacterized membrane protein YhaH (DUF805 family)
MRAVNPILAWLRDSLRVYLTGWRLTFRFRGRTSRRDFWIFYLVHSVLLVGLVIADSVHPYAVPYLSVIFSYASLVTIVSIGVRRLHDIDASGKWMFLMLLPLGGVLLVVPHARKGSAGTNRFGDPACNTSAPAESHVGVPARFTQEM